MEIILFILFIVVGITFRILQPKIKGYVGEKSVAVILSFLPSDKYYVIHDVLIKSGDRTTQIDHIVVSIYGIFVIETKNYKGWIIGSDNSEYWTKNVFGNKYTFYNPIKQNRGHIFTLSKQLQIHHNNFIPIIAFSNNADLRINSSYNVIYITQINGVIKQYDEIKFSKADVLKIVEKINNLNIVSSDIRKQHIIDTRNTIATKHYLEESGICPKCGHALVVKNGKYGSFWGCSNYPRCHFTKPIEQQNFYFFNKSTLRFIKRLFR